MVRCLATTFLAPIMASRTARHNQNTSGAAASLPGARLRMRIVIALRGRRQRPAAGQERLTEVVKRRAGEVIIALRGGVGATKVRNWLQSQQMDTGLAILCRPHP